VLLTLFALLRVVVTLLFVTFLLWLFHIVSHVAVDTLLPRCPFVTLLLLLHFVVVALRSFCCYCCCPVVVIYFPLVGTLRYVVA